MTSNNYLAGIRALEAQLSIHRDALEVSERNIAFARKNVSLHEEEHAFQVATVAELMRSLLILDRAAKLEADASTMGLKVAPITDPTEPK